MTEGASRVRSVVAGLAGPLGRREPQAKIERMALAVKSSEAGECLA